MILSTQEFNRISQYMKTHYGINLTDKKKTLVETRLQKEVIRRQFSSYNEYLDFIIKDQTGEELKLLLNHLTTNHTYFMREVEHFDFLKSTILPTFFRQPSKEKDLRIWCAGCSTGQEPYTISMLVSDYIEQQYPNFQSWDRQMLATDISDRALKIAIEGSYDIEDLRDLPNSWLKKYFTKNGSSCKINKSLKNEILFRKFNLMNQQFPFKKQFHTIFCRNVMIYFDTPTKDALIERFYDALVPGGYLIIGHSEFIDRVNSSFDYVQPAIYRKPGGVDYA